MAKKRSASSAHGRRAAKSARPIPDSRIDFSDIPGIHLTLSLSAPAASVGPNHPTQNSSSRSASIRDDSCAFAVSRAAGKSPQYHDP